MATGDMIDGGGMVGADDDGAADIEALDTEDTQRIDDLEKRVSAIESIMRIGADGSRSAPKNPFESHIGVPNPEAFGGGK